MNRNQLIDILIPVLKPFLADKGFKWLSSKECFSKQILDGWLRVTFHTYPEKGCICLEPSLSIRNNIVENLYNKYMYVNSKEINNTSTISSGFFTIDKKPRHSLIICNENDALNAANFTLNFLASRGLSFLENHAKVEQLESIFNDPLYHHFVEHYIYINRAFHSVILAKLLERANYNEIVQKWNTLLSENNVGGNRMYYPDRFNQMLADMENL